MDICSILVTCFIISGTILGIYTSVRRFYLTLQIKKSGVAILQNIIFVVILIIDRYHNI